MHVAMPFSADGRRMRAARGDEWAGVTVHWRSRTDRVEWDDGISPVLVAAEHTAQCQPPHLAIAVLDSLLHRRMASLGGVQSVLAAMPAHVRKLAPLVDGRSEEGIESIARYRLHEAGITAVPQVPVPGVGRVDLLIDGWLAIELDGRETHAQERAFSADRRRSALLLQHGVLALHFSYAHVLYEWPLILATVQAALRQH
ncbi:endonuclease domain-containing protein [Naasia aerilata]|nr:hypothetical protein [Naasia aerilata]